MSRTPEASLKAIFKTRPRRAKPGDAATDAKDNWPRPNHVYHLNPSESSPTGNVATLTMTIPFPLQEALRDSITSGTFVDTKFWLFSKRVASKPGRVGDPKPLFVNGHVAKRVPRLASRALISVILDT